MVVKIGLPKFLTVAHRLEDSLLPAFRRAKQLRRLPKEMGIYYFSEPVRKETRMGFSGIPPRLRKALNFSELSQNT